MSRDRSKIKVVLDARMINTSGIGRYISELIPELLKLYTDLTLLGSKPEIQLRGLHTDAITVMEFNCEIYSIKEQFLFIKRIPRCDIFIAPHYNAPILSFRYKKLITFFPDVNHLAFGELGVAKKLYANLMYNLASFRSKVVITISDFSRQEILKYLKIKPNKLVVAKCGINKADLRALYENRTEINLPEKPYILYVGNIKPHKNLKRALQAFEIAIEKYPDLLFYIVGKKDGFITGDNELFEQLQENEKIREKVAFTGFINDQELVNFYARASMLLFPSLYEGFGLPPLEAMALECPVVTSNLSSLPEICGDAAVYCNPLDIEDIARKIEFILSDSEFVLEKIEKGKEQVENYRWHDFTQKITEQIDEIVF